MRIKLLFWPFSLLKFDFLKKKGFSSGEKKVRKAENETNYLIGTCLEQLKGWSRSTAAGPTSLRVLTDPDRG